MKSYAGWGHRMPDYQLMAPFPYFGGKRNAAAVVWEALGDPGGYIEPFAGSAAVLLGRPPFEGQRMETINDADGLVINAWRAIKHDPVGVAREACWPVSEVDYHARAAWLSGWRADDPIPKLEGNPEWYDTKAAAWWLYVSACSIGTGALGGGPWHVTDGRLVKTERSERGITRSIPHIGGSPKGILRYHPEHFGETVEKRTETYLKRLQARLIRVRITAGDWTRPLAKSALSLATTTPHVGIFLDPPYLTSGDIYHASRNVDQVMLDVLDWCQNADPELRIVLAGYNNDADALLDLGWTKTESIGGSGNSWSNDPKAGRRERLWMSPTCHQAQGSLFDAAPNLGTGDQ